MIIIIVGKDNLGNANFGILLQFPSPAPIYGSLI